MNYAGAASENTKVEAEYLQPFVSILASTEDDRLKPKKSQKNFLKLCESSKLSQLEQSQLKL